MILVTCVLSGGGVLFGPNSGSTGIPDFEFLMLGCHSFLPLRAVQHPQSSRSIPLPPCPRRLQWFDIVVVGLAAHAKAPLLEATLGALTPSLPLRPINLIGRAKFCAGNAFLLF